VSESHPSNPDGVVQSTETMFSCEVVMHVTSGTINHFSVAGNKAIHVTTVLHQDGQNVNTPVVLTFAQWTLAEARYEPEEVHSWVWHPFHGVQTERGYMQHERIMKSKPELRKMPTYKDGKETETDYDPPRGTARVDRAKKEVHYARYDQSKFGLKGGSDSADAKDVHAHIRKNFNVPKDFKSVTHDEPKWWHNSKDMERREFAKR
jgi:hypothetical protein